jgi:hypothetical protein
MAHIRPMRGEKRHEAPKTYARAIGPHGRNRGELIRSIIGGEFAKAHRKFGQKDLPVPREPS